MVKLDNINFDEELIDLYFESAIDYVFDLFQDTIVEEENIINQEVINEPIVDEHIEETAVGDDNEINQQELDLFSFVRSRIVNENEDSSNHYEKVEARKKELRTRIKNSMDMYRKECRNMSMTKYLEDNGNEYYNTMLKKNIDHKRITEWQDALYVSKFFDSVKWWQDHASKYPELAAAATIILGKPTHNAFQERVFSRGTYSDTKLRKRLKE
jgi:hypothetical protein